MACVAVVAMAFGVYLGSGKTTISEEQQINVEGLRKAVIFERGRPLEEFRFTSHENVAFEKQQLLGYWNIVFFGFTSCPDICPTTMHTLKQVKKQLRAQDRWGNYRVIMVSVDPERDTPERLAAYVPFYDSEFVGLTAPLEATTEFAKKLGVLFVAHETDDNGRYDVDHSTALILINPDAEFAGLISAPHKQEEIVADLATLASYFADDHATPVAVSNAGTKSRDQASHTTNRDSDAEESIAVSNAWVRAAAPGASAMAAYMTLNNPSANAMEIIAVTSPQFDEVMIHETIADGEMAAMNHLDSLTLPPNANVELKPLGKHIMLVDPLVELALGDEVELTFELAGQAPFKTSMLITNPE